LYPNAVLRGVPAPPPRPRVFVPLGGLEAVARALRGEGFATVPALSGADTPERLRCTHVLRDGRAVPLPTDG
ncbi:MAG: hypothetical protein AVDCRST_MAG40-1341, partial [uncultured Gemmatimonadaceae bacterium]